MEAFRLICVSVKRNLINMSESDASAGVYVLAKRVVPSNGVEGVISQAFMKRLVADVRSAAAVM
jgi:hypothetical protein